MSQVETDVPAKDWRMGLLVKPKYRRDRLFRQLAKVIDVLPSGTYGIDDANGVLVVQYWLLDKPLVVVGPADDWVTA